MDSNFERLLPYKTEAELQHYLNNRAGFPPSTVQMIIEELKKRGKVFTPEEIASIKNDMVDEPATADTGNTSTGFWSSWNRNIVDDPAAPELYSQMAINGFSIFFSTLFGAILFAINMHRVGKGDKIYIVMLFALTFTIFEGWLVTMQPQITSLPFIFNIIGGVLLNTVFWNKYIGKNTQHRRRAIWPPLLIGVAISVIFVIALMGGMVMPK